LVGDEFHQVEPESFSFFVVILNLKLGSDGHIRFGTKVDDGRGNDNIQAGLGIGNGSGAGVWTGTGSVSEQREIGVRKKGQKRPK
jgi:hypothetical protein